MNKKRLLAVLAGSLLSAMAGLAQAGLLWGNNASSSVVIEAVDATTGAVVHQFAAGAGNGRGVVVVGNTVYWTRVGDPRIYKMNATTGAAEGSILTTVSSMSTIAWDGTHFWTSDYSGTNRAFRIDTAGNVVQTINLPNAGSNMDGMEFFNGKLISNRGDAVGPYDIYDLNGNLLVASFINPGVQTTGIAYDGTNFITSNIFANSVSYWNGVTGAFISTLTIGGPAPASCCGRLWEDLSVDYAERADTAVPEPASIALLSLGLLGLGWSRRRKA